MKLPVIESKGLQDFFADENETKDDILAPEASYPNGKDEDNEPEEDDDYEDTYGDLEDGHDDLNQPESDRGVDNLE